MSGSNETVLWTIGADDGRGPDLIDTYENPTVAGEVRWRVGAGGQRWPNYHPSEADPLGGYRTYPYAIEFGLDTEPSGGYRLRIRYLAIAPRLADLEIDVNGDVGVAYLRPAPSRSGEIRLHAGLHTAIYSEGVAEVIVPAALLRRGANRLVLTARDGGDVLRVDNLEAIRRLDRMANGAGLVYQSISLVQTDAAPESVLATAEVRPSVVYRAGDDGVLRERCHLYLELAGPIDRAHLELELRGGAQTQVVALDLPATPFGHLHVPFDLIDGAGPVDYALRGVLGGESVEWQGRFARKRKWTVYVAPHVHTDIGYTHRQWEVEERLCRVVDAALDLIDPPRAEALEQRATQLHGSSVSALEGLRPVSPALLVPGPERYGASPPQTAPGSGDPSPFAFHLDSTWALERYLQTRSQRQVRRLFAQVAAGRFGVPGQHVDLLTHLAALEDLVRNQELAHALLRPEGLRTDFSAIVDVASLSGALPAVLEGGGIRYLVHANNQDRGPFRLLGGLHRRSPYYWEGTNGGRVLVWLSRMYCELRKVCGSPPVLASAERGLDLWLDEYETADYAPDAVLLYGQEADNTDLDPQPAAFLRDWNRTYSYPRLVPSNVSDFFRDVEARFGAAFPTVRGDGGAYWEDGAGSAQAATASLRRAQATLPAAEAIEALAVIHGDDLAYPAESFDEAWRQLLLADEHTWGAFLSGPDPEALLARDQWAIKRQMIDGAASWADRLLHVAATRHGLSWNSDGRAVVVYNPHSWPVSGPATVEIGPAERLVDPATGAAVPVRRLRTTTSQAVVELRVDDLPGLSYRRFSLRASDPSAEASGPPPDGDIGPGERVVLENRFFRLELDTGRGAATSWRDKELDRELIDGADTWGFGQLVYARGGEGTRLMSNRADLPDGDPELLGDFEVLDARVERWEGGTSLRLEGNVSYGHLVVEWTLPSYAKQLEIRYAYDKEARLAKEAAYVAFPLALPGARVESDAQLGWVDWARDQLPGGCKEWLPLQTGVLVSASDAAVLVCSPDVPLFCVGDVVRGRWPRELDLSGGRLFSYVLNNYWHTNYPAAQGGPLAFSYVLTSAAAVPRERAYRLGWQTRRPLYAQRLSYQDFREPRDPYRDPTGGTLAEIAGDRVVLSTLKPARWLDGWIARLQEIGGQEAVARIRLPGHPIGRAWLTNLVEDEIRELPVEPDGCLRVPVAAWDLATVRLAMAPHSSQPSGSSQ
jgi:alpha-mannosidase